MRNLNQFYRIQSFLFVIALFAFASSAFTWSPWIKLGSRTVSYAADWDEIYVTGRMGTFNAIGIEVRKSDVHLTRVVVHYRNGTKEVVPVHKRIAAGSMTKPLNLKGVNRVINRVTFHYTTPLSEYKKSKVVLYGRR